MRFATIVPGLTHQCATPVSKAQPDPLEDMLDFLCRTLCTTANRPKKTVKNLDGLPSQARQGSSTCFLEEVGPGQRIRLTPRKGVGRGGRRPGPAIPVVELLRTFNWKETEYRNNNAVPWSSWSSPRFAPTGEQIQTDCSLLSVVVSTCKRYRRHYLNKHGCQTWQRTFSCIGRKRKTTPTPEGIKVVILLEKSREYHKRGQKMMHPANAQL